MKISEVMIGEPPKGSEHDSYEPDPNQLPKKPLDKNDKIQKKLKKRAEKKIKKTFNSWAK